MCTLSDTAPAHTGIRHMCREAHLEHSCHTVLPLQTYAVAQ